MAIKGKKRSKGSKAGKRPPGAPRVMVAPRPPTPWHRRTRIRIIAALTALLIVVALVVTISAAGGDLQERQDALASYTTRVQTIQTTLAPPVAELLAVTLDPASIGRGTKRLARETVGTLLASQAEVINPPAAAETANRLFQESITIYVEVAQLLASISDVDPENRDALLANLNALVARAEAVWGIGADDLDAARLEVELDAANLLGPAALGGPAPGASTTGGGGNG